MYLICYMDRSNISVAQPEIAKQFHLSKSAMGLVLAAFTWAYALGQVPAGWLGDRFGAKKVLTVIMTWWSAAAMMTGAAIGLWSLFSARFLLGIGEAGAFPVASRGMLLWFPRSERGRIQGMTHFFSRFAVAVTPFVAGQHHDRVRMAGDLLYFRISREFCGRSFSIVLTGTGPKIIARESGRTGRNPRR